MALKGFLVLVLALSSVAVTAKPNRYQTKNSAARPSRSAAPMALNTKIEQYVRADANGWLFNQIDSAPFSKFEMLEENTNNTRYKVKAYYYYNGGSQGWVIAVVENQSIKCLEYWDRAGSCREVNYTPNEWNLTKRRLTEPLSSSNREVQVYEDSDFDDDELARVASYFPKSAKLVVVDIGYKYTPPKCDRDELHCRDAPVYSSGQSRLSIENTSSAQIKIRETCDSISIKIVKPGERLRLLPECYYSTSK